MSSLGWLFLAPAAVALILLAAPARSAEPPRDWNRPTRDWYQGPVRYLLTHEEERTFRSLTTEDERARFIEDFWARRDENPSTPVNEFEIRFWTRVEEADHRFHDAPYPGWKTDRGKLYVLLGAPDEIRQGQASAPLNREVPFVIWIYHQPRFEGMDRDTEIRFLRDDSGEFRMTDQLLLSRLERFSGAARDRAYQAAAAQRPPKPREILDTISALHPPMDPGRFRTHYDFFKAADGSTSVAVTVGIRLPDSDPSRPALPQTAPDRIWKVYARLTGSSASYDLAQAESFRTGDAGREVDGFRLFQGRISVPPGSYSVLYGIQDAGTSELFSLTDRLQVPDFSRDVFSLSGLALAARLEPAESGGTEEPFLVGRMRVVPKMDPVYRAGTDLAYYFQVYHPPLDPQTGQPSLDLTYQVYQATQLRKTGEVTYSPIGKPLHFENQSGLVHGYAFPLTGWPAGDFKMKITVRDRITGETLESEARFSVR